MQIQHKNVQLNDELSFLIVCCQIDTSDKDILFITSYLSHITDHKSLITTAIQHGILPLVYKTLKKVLQNSSSLNTALLNELRVHYQSIAQRNMLMSAELIRIMKLLKENGIEALAFKGPSLAQIAYGDITLRQYSDLDILVKQEDIIQSVTILNQYHYDNIDPVYILHNKICLQAAKDFSLLNSQNNILIEMHWKLLDHQYMLKTHSFFKKDLKRKIDINTYPIYTFSNELLLVYLCIHGSKHMWERLEWICDIDRLINSCDIFWDKTTELADELNSQRAFFLGLKLARHFFNSAIPTYLNNDINTKEINNLMHRTFNQLNAKTETRSLSAYRKNELIYHALLFDSFYEKVFFFFRGIFKISKGDCKTLQVPQKMHFLYTLFRPIRLIYKYIFHKSKAK